MELFGRDQIRNAIKHLIWKLSTCVLREGEVTGTYCNQFVTEKIVVMQGGNHALLGLNWLLELKLDWNSLFPTVNAIHNPSQIFLQNSRRCLPMA